MLKHRLFFLFKVLILYFVGYLIVLPSFLTRLTLMIQPYATRIHPITLFCGYFGFLAVMIYVSKEELLKGYKIFKLNKKKCISIILKNTLFLLLLVSILSSVASYLFKTAGSSNQLALNSQSVTNPCLTVFVTCIFAPIVEECIFRGSILPIFEDQRYKFFGLCISAAIFGFIHVMSYLFSSGLSEIGYWFIYSMIGYVIGRAYFKSQSLIVCILIHALYNTAACIIMFC